MNHKVLIGIYFSFFCLSLTSSTAIAATKTLAKSKTKSVKGANSECLTISKTLQKSQNASQLQSALKKTGKNKIKACASYLKKQKSLSTTLNKISKQEISKQQTLLRHLKTKPLKRATPSSQLKINQRIKRLQIKARAKIQTHQPVKKYSGKRLVERSRVAKITKLTPATVAPGANIVIEGSGFGEQPGTVQLRVNGRPIDDASVDSWEDGWINAFFPASITNVIETANAVLRVTTNSGKKIDHTVKFIPVYQQQIVLDSHLAQFPLLSYFSDFFDPGREYYRYDFYEDIILVDGWKVKSYAFVDTNGRDVTGRNECERANPFLRIGHRSLDSRVRYFRAGVELAPFCSMEVIIEGPVGIESGMEGWQGNMMTEEPKRL